MGKIRSTLDIVMERTKNLSMSQDDRRNLRRRELADQARAAVRKYLDARMTLREMASELDASAGERPELLELVKAGLLENVRIDGDNSRVLDALENLCGMDRGTVAERVRAFREMLDAEMARELEGLRAGLEAKGIRGSSVIPNVARSSAWRDALGRSQKNLADALGSGL